jgi:hypothetical protein
MIDLETIVEWIIAILFFIGLLKLSDKIIGTTFELLPEPVIYILVGVIAVGFVGVVVDIVIAAFSKTYSAHAGCSVGAVIGGVLALIFWWRDR